MRLLAACVPWRGGSTRCDGHSLCSCVSETREYVFGGGGSADTYASYCPVSLHSPVKLRKPHTERELNMISKRSLECQRLPARCGKIQNSRTSFFCQLPDLQACATFAGLRLLKAPYLQFSTTVEEIVEISGFSPQTTDADWISSRLSSQFGC